MNEHEDKLFDLVEALQAAVGRGEAIDQDLYAERFGVATTEVDDCLRALAALDLSLGEDDALGLPELPQPHFPATYAVGREIGRGGMGVVYEAVEQGLDRRVALKVLRPGDLHFGDAIRRFRGEARALARLRHPHIVSVHSVGETKEGLVFYAMDLVDGDTLAEEIAEADGLTPTQSLRLMRQVTAAVTHAHAQGIIHRDLKPQNVLIDAQGDAFVCDFGLAQDALVEGVGMTRTGNLLGTPAYMSPEQASGKTREIGEATDVWALGALLYECLTGRGPFSDRPLHETIRAILHDDPTPPRRIDRRIPQALESIALTALRKDPAQRYATVEAFGEDLERFADGRQITARPPTISDRAASLARRNRKPLTFAAAALVLFTVFVGFFVIPEVQQATRIAEAERAIDSGFPGAALQVLDGSPVETPLEGVRLATALNDRAGELLADGDSDAARAAAERAIKLGERFGVSGYFSVRQDKAEGSVDAWRWEALRSRRLAVAAGTSDSLKYRLFPLPNPMDSRWFEGLQSPLRGRRSAAFRIGAVLGLSVIKDMPEDMHIPAILDWHRSLAHEFPMPEGVAPREAWIWQPWTPDVHRVLWSAELEDSLAAFVQDETEPAMARAFAYRSWAQLTGMPYQVSHSPWEDDWVAPVLERAPEQIALWKGWRELTREEALEARIFHVLGILPRRGTTIDAFTGHLVSFWTGVPWPTIGDGTLIPLERNEVTVREWIHQRLGDAAFRLTPLECLERAANSRSAESALWRHLAWIGLPEGVRVPEGRLLKWRGSRAFETGYEHWFEVFGSSRPTPYVATAAMIAFDNGSADPIVVDTARLPAAPGSRLEFELIDPDRNPDPPRRHSRGFQDSVHGSVASLRRYRHMPILSKRLSLEMRTDESGVMLTTPGTDFGGGYRGGSRIWTKDAHRGGGVGLGQARATHYISVEDRVRGTFREYLLMFRLDEVGKEPGETDLGSWRQGVVTHLTAAAEEEDLGADILTPRFWSLPEAKDAIERIQDHLLYTFGNRNSRMRAGPLFSPSIGWLAGVDRAEDRPITSFYHASRVEELLRQAIHAPRAEWRKRAFDRLATMEGLWIPSALEKSLLASAARDGASLPAALQHALDRSRAARTAGWTEAPILGYLGLAALLLIVTALATRASFWGRLAAWVAIGLATYMTFELLDVDGTDYFPTWICLGLAAYASLRTSLRRETLEMRIVAAVLFGTVALLELGFDLGVVTFAAHTWPLGLLVIAGLALLTTIRWHAPSQRRRALA